MSNVEDRLYDLVEITERQQAVAQTLLDGLTRQMEALDPAVRRAVQESLAGIATTVAATQPLVSEMAAVTQTAGQAEKVLRDLVTLASWRLYGRLLGVLVVLMLLTFGASRALLWWDTSEIRAAQHRKAELQAEVTEMQANYDDWVKRGMLGKITFCDPSKRRPCIRVDESAGAYGDNSDYRVIKGY